MIVEQSNWVMKEEGRKEGRKREEEECGGEFIYF